MCINLDSLLRTSQDHFQFLQAPSTGRKSSVWWKKRSLQIYLGKTSQVSILWLKTKHRYILGQGLYLDPFWAFLSHIFIILFFFPSRNYIQWPSKWWARIMAQRVKTIHISKRHPISKIGRIHLFNESVLTNVFFLSDSRNNDFTLMDKQSYC